MPGTAEIGSRCATVASSTARDGGTRPLQRGNCKFFVQEGTGPSTGCPAPISAWVGVYVLNCQEGVDAVAMDGGGRLPQRDNCKFYGARLLQVPLQPWTGGIGSSTRHLAHGPKATTRQIRRH